MALKIFSVIEQIEAFLKKQDKNQLIDYRLVLKIDSEIDITLWVSKKGFLEKKISDCFSEYINRIYIREVTNDEFDDGYLKWIFSADNPLQVDYGLRYRLNNLIDFVKQEGRILSKTPVVTFYSYKGGMGRSTTLACFASYLAKKEGKKVVVVDCDFEAPGFTNYYDLSPDLLSQKSGVVEYFLDKDFLTDSDIKISLKDDYSFPVGHEYVGNGQITVIPAGNLWEDIGDNSNSGFSNRVLYLEGLARLDIASVDNIIEKFESLIKDIEEEFEPDVILFDSRTGFNDVFATLASVSNVLVGFFGINQQNIVGLEQFLSTFGKIDSRKKVFVVNSIISSVEFYDTFDGIVSNYLENQSVIFGEKIVNTYSVQRYLELEKIGTSHAYKRNGHTQTYDANFVDIIDKNIIFQPLFGDINQVINQLSNRDNPEQEYGSIEISGNSNSIDLSHYNHLGLDTFIDLRKRFIETFNKNIPVSSHAEDTTPTLENFYFRESMKDIFNRDKFLIKGSKGTGKTFLYQAFENEAIRQKLQEKANLTKGNFHFLNLVSLHNDINGNQYFETTEFDMDRESFDYDFFFKRFWIVYIWNSIMLKLNESTTIDYVSPLEILAIENTPTQKSRFESMIYNEDTYKQIYEDLENLDKQLQKKDENLIILIEQLDYIVLPIHWSKGVSPLINFWRSNPFKRILPKIFIRADLMDRLTGTNYPNWANRTIEIEWTKKELFSFVFKLILQNQKEDFIKLMAYCGHYDNVGLLEEMLQVSSDSQVPLDDKFLRPLVEWFFGKYANWTDTDIDSGMGQSYEWFEKNLKDGNDRISLRTLIDMLRLATQKFIDDKRYNKYLNCVIPASCYADNNVREKCVIEQFNGLAKEKGNEPLNEFKAYITTNGRLDYKVPTFRRNDFATILNNIFTTTRNNESMKRIKKPDDLKELLISNGIIKETVDSSRNYRNYIIPFLYRNFFEVSNQNMREK